MDAGALPLFTASSLRDFVFGISTVFKMPAPQKHYDYLHNFNNVQHQLVLVTLPLFSIRAAIWYIHWCLIRVLRVRERPAPLI